MEKTLYEKKEPFSDEYICRVTGKKCETVSEHFKDFRFAVAYMAEHEINYPFFTRERNLCRENNCCIWQDFIQKQAQTNTL